MSLLDQIEKEKDPKGQVQLGAIVAPPDENNSNKFKEVKTVSIVKKRAPNTWYHTAIYKYFKEDNDHHMRPSLILDNYSLLKPTLITIYFRGYCWGRLSFSAMFRSLSLLPRIISESISIILQVEKFSIIDSEVLLLF